MRTSKVYAGDPCPECDAGVLVRVGRGTERKLNCNNCNHSDVEPP